MRVVSAGGTGPTELPVVPMVTGANRVAAGGSLPYKNAMQSRWRQARGLPYKALASRL